MFVVYYSSIAEETGKHDTQKEIKERYVKYDVHLNFEDYTSVPYF